MSDSTLQIAGSTPAQVAGSGLGLYRRAGKQRYNRFQNFPARHLQKFC